MRATMELMLRLHDGDDRCGCLRVAIVQLLDELPDEAEATVHVCLQQHPSGSLYRSLYRPLDRTHGRTDGRTDGEAGQVTRANDT